MRVPGASSGVRGSAPRGSRAAQRRTVTKDRRGSRVVWAASGAAGAGAPARDDGEADGSGGGGVGEPVADGDDGADSVRTPGGERRSPSVVPVGRAGSQQQRHQRAHRDAHRGAHRDAATHRHSREGTSSARMGPSNRTVGGRSTRHGGCCLRCARRARPALRPPTRRCRGWSRGSTCTDRSARRVVPGAQRHRLRRGHRRPARPAAVRALRDVHVRLGETFPRPPFDGPRHLERPGRRRTMPRRAGHHRRHLARRGPHRRSPVTWHELAWHGVPGAGRSSRTSTCGRTRRSCTSSATAT